MRKTSVRELHIHTSALVREAAEGGVILIERRGEAVAELRPLSTPAGLSRDKKESILAEMQDLWTQMPRLSDSTELIEEDRNR